MKMNLGDKLEGKKTERKIDGGLVSIIITLITLIIVMITLKENVPLRIFQIITSVAIFLLVAFSLKAFFPFAKSYLSIFLTKRQQNKIINENIEEVRYYIQKFDEFLDVYNRENVVRVLYDIILKKQDSESKMIGLQTFLIDKSIFSHMRSLYRNINDFVQDRKRTKIEDFEIVIKQFDALLTLYTSLIYKIIEKMKEQGIIIEDLSKENFNQKLEEFLDYIKKYIDFGDKFNYKLNKNIFRVYFDLPQKL